MSVSIEVGDIGPDLCAVTVTEHVLNAKGKRRSQTREVMRGHQEAALRCFVSLATGDKPIPPVQALTDEPPERARPAGL
jgi:hypothetical protein